MRKHRPFLNAFLGLMLWVQGVAIAGTPVQAPATGADSTPASMEMPCHGQASSSTAPCDCCDGDCDNMVGCAVGSFVAPPAVAVAADAPGYIVVAAKPWSTPSTVVPLPLRPPITSHA